MNRYFLLNLKVIFLLCLLVTNEKEGCAQEKAIQQFFKLSCHEKWWVMKHPFKAKRALIVSNVVRQKTDSIRIGKYLKGNGNGGQVDAFRHTLWILLLTNEIGGRAALRLGRAHEKGNYRQFVRGKKEDGDLPDEASSKMDLYNNEVGNVLAEKGAEDLIGLVVEAVKKGKCKVLKTDVFGRFLNVDNQVIEVFDLKGEWNNGKCLVESDLYPFK